MPRKFYRRFVIYAKLGSEWAGGRNNLVISQRDKESKDKESRDKESRESDKEFRAKESRTQLQNIFLTHLGGNL